MESLLQIENLRVQFKTYAGLVKAVDGVSLSVQEREIVGLVGESGCGKSVTVLSILKLIPMPPGQIVSGSIFFEGDNLLEYDPQGEKMRRIRGRKIAMIFQEPMTSLNPVLTIGRQITEALEEHFGMTPSSAQRKAIELLQRVGVADSKTRMGDYPHQLSGGMRQRVMIAIALSCNPKLIVADEPTTALDVTTQAQLLELMKETVDQFQTSLIIVTHNLGIVARYAQRIYVMYAGRIVESGLADDIFEDSRHPYTIGLLNCVPQLGESRRKRRLVPIFGLPPNLIDMPQHCAFFPRCPYGTEICKTRPWPPLRKVGHLHWVSCHLDIGRR